MNSEQDKERYLIEGNLPVGLLKFAAPFMLAYLLQALYGAVDLMIIGQFCDAGAVSAVGIGAQLLHLLLSVLFGLSVGGTVLIGYNLGAKNPEGTANAIGSTATLFAIIALAVAPIAALSTERCVRAMQTPPEAFEYACQYVFICACGIPFIVGYNVVGAIYRGLGDSFTPTIFVAVACAFNVVGRPCPHRRLQRARFRNVGSRRRFQSRSGGRGVRDRRRAGTELSARAGVYAPQEVLL